MRMISTAITMSHFIITAIIALASAKAIAQEKENLTKPKCREVYEGKREVAKLISPQK